ncbi:MAG: rod shape-determining protein MreD [Nitrospinae bacterium]|nr:rod shape-determining protein MreD [Nitrospinota bacterium]
MHYAVLFLFLATVFSIQTTFLDLFPLGGTLPDLGLIVAVYCGIHGRGDAGIGMGCFIGFVQDCLSGRLLGVNTLSKGLTGFFFATLKNKIVVEGFIPLCFFLALASLFDGVIFYLAWNLLLKGESSGGYLFPYFLVNAVYNALLGQPLFFLMNRGRKWLDGRFPNQILGFP